MESLNSSLNMTQYHTHFETEQITSSCNMEILNNNELKPYFMEAYSNLFVNAKNNTLSVFLNPFDAINKSFEELMNNSREFDRITFDKHGNISINSPFKHTMEPFICNGQTYLLIKVDNTVCVICLETLKHCTLHVLSSTSYEIASEQYAALYRSYPQDNYTNYDEYNSLCDIPAVIPGQMPRYGIHQIYMDYRCATYSITDRDNKNIIIAVDFLKDCSVKITKMMLIYSIPSTNMNIS